MFFFTVPNKPRGIRLLAGCIALSLSGSAVAASSDTYMNFPVTVKGYDGSKKHSVKYTGQIARHLLHESLKKLAGKGNGSPNPVLRDKMLAYYAGKEPGRVILAPTSNGKFAFVQSGIDDISKKKNLAGKTYGGTITAWPGNMSGPDVVKFWIDKASAANGGYDLANGYHYAQLISKFIMGAVFYNQIADKYLDENLEANKKPNDKPYKKGAPYTGKEHSWDEAYGYFGAAAHALKLSAKQNYEVAKRGTKSSSPQAALALADHNGDGKVDYYSEMTYALAYYASSYDKSGKTHYLEATSRAFLDGRKLLVAAAGKALSDDQRTKLKGYAGSIKGNLERVIAESVFKYAGESYEDIQKLQAVLKSGGNSAKTMKKYVKHWSELKGFSMALQVGGKDLGAVAAQLNRLIGFGPVLANSSHVVNIDSAGNYTKGKGTKLAEYSLRLLKVQALMTEEFGVKARSHDQLSNLASLAEALSDANSSEND